MQHGYSIDDISARTQSLRQSQTVTSTRLVEKFKSRIDAVENLRLWGVIVTVSGACVAALARMIEGDWGFGLAIGGAVAAAVAGLIVALMDRRKLEISTEATTAIESADVAIATAEEASSALQGLLKITEAFDKKRRERLAAFNKMVEAIEANLLSESVTPQQAAELLLRRAVHSIRSSVDYEGGDFFTLTIFQKKEVEGVTKMCRIAAEWTDPDKALAGGRSWAIGKGYTGVAWQNATTNPNGDVIIPDTSKHEIRAQYPVDDWNPDRESLYRSVAAIPILINERNDVWGIVTATSDRIGVFERDSENINVQNVDVIRDVATVAALLPSFELEADNQ